MRATRGRRSRGLRLQPGAVSLRAEPARAVRILGLDPGSVVTGFGVVDVGPKGTSYLASGSIRAGRGALADRLQLIFRHVTELVETYAPGEVAIERVFMHANPDSALKLGQARGAALCAAGHGGAAIHEYTPREVKLAVTGTGGAEKEQVQHMVRALLGLQGRLGADAADALAIALCHSHHLGLGRPGGFR
jgi:crossover junction endodeoxyribonuclease RuvC